MVRWLVSIARFLIVAVLVAVAFELGSNFLLWTESKKIPLLEARPAAPILGPTEGHITKIHPYFGFMTVDSKAYGEKLGFLINNFGFPTLMPYAKKFEDCCDLPMLPQNHPDTFFVAVFGNSISQGVGAEIQLSEEDQEKLAQLPAAKNKRVLVLNLANGGYKQPQDLFVLSYMLSAGMKFDLVLYLASPLSPIAGIANAQSGVAIEYPTGVWLTLSRSLEQLSSNDVWSITGILFLRAAQNTQQRIDQCQSASCVIVYRPVLRLERTLADELAVRLSVTGLEQPHFINFPVPPASEKVENLPQAAVESWRVSTMLMAAITKASGGEFLEVMMPTPWIHPSGAVPPGATPSDVDLYRKEMPPIAADLDRANKELRSRGINVLDATRVFDDLPVDLTYADPSGHMKKDGVVKLNEFVLDFLLRKAGKSDAPAGPKENKQ